MLNIRLFYDPTRLKRVPEAINFTDLVSNYDQLVQSIASFSLKRSNIPKETSGCTYTTLQNMYHSVRTAFEYSESTYDSNKWTLPLKPPPQYLGHVNVYAPTIWTIVRTSLLDFLRYAGHGEVFKCRIPQYFLKLVGYCFIDDSRIIQIAPSPTTPKKYI